MQPSGRERLASRRWDNENGTIMIGRFAANAIATLLVMLVLDGVWLTQVAGPMYRGALGDLLVPGFRKAPAVAFYLIYGLGLTALAELPEASLGAIAARGAVFGFAAYATYELTNLATLKAWTMRLVLTDLAWGTVLSAVASASGAAIGGVALRALAAR